MLRLSVSGGWLGLPQDMVSDLVAGATTRSLSTGETLFRAGDVGDGCYRLDEGLLKVSLISSEAEERIIAILKRSHCRRPRCDGWSTKVGNCRRLHRLQTPLHQPGPFRALCPRPSKNI